MLDIIFKIGAQVVKHVADNKETYRKVAKGVAVGATAVAAGTAVYKTGKSKGHTQGKKEGVAEQAQRDAVKFRQQEQAHNADRAEWKKISKKKDDLIDELGNQLFENK